MSDALRIGRPSPRWLADAAVAFGLMAALGTVFWLDRGGEPPEPSKRIPLQVREVAADDKQPEQAQLRLGVTPAQYDDMGRLLDSLGKGYQYETVELESLLETRWMDEIDVLFLTCGGVPKSWLGEMIGKSARDDATEYHPNEEVINRVCKNLRDFVDNGGTLYASDWRFSLVATAFVEYVDPPRAVQGAPQTVQAEVVSPRLKKPLGETIELRFDKPGWYTSAFRGADVEVLLQGEIQTMDEERLTAPLLVRFPYGSGTVVFTSFHNEEENTDVAVKLLRLLIFTTIIAQSDAFATKRMADDGFQAADRNLLSASRDAPSVTHTYICERDGMDLRFALAFPAAGARLRLLIEDPQGRYFEKEVTSTYIVEVPEAAAGQWTYAVQAVELPYPNFPFTISVAEKSAD
jgi:hypothetical protein